MGGDPAMRFATAMTSRTDEELVEIVKGPADDWEPEAVEAAKAEIEKRGLQIEPPGHPYREREPPPRPNNDAAEPLSRGMRAAALVLGLFLSVLGALISVGVMSSYAKKGQRRMGTEFATWAFAGAAISFALTMLCR